MCFAVHCGGLSVVCPLCLQSGDSSDSDIWKELKTVAIQVASIALTPVKNACTKHSPVFVEHFFQRSMY
jgi:hypothetical protein